MKNFKLILSFGISILLVVFVAQSVDWAKLKIEFANANYLPFFTATIAWFVLFILRAQRWNYLLPIESKSTLTLRTESLVLGSLATFILPLRAGEFIRPFFLAKNSNISFLTGFVSVFIERFFDLICVLGLFALVAPGLTSFPAWALAGVKALGVLAVCIFIFMIAASVAPKKLIAITTFCCQFFPEKIKNLILKIVTDIIQGATAISSFKRFSLVIVYTIAIWIMNIVIFYLFLPVVGIQADLYVSSTLTALIALAVAAPSAPGFIGVYQVATVACFSLFDLPIEKATAFSVLSHIHQYALFIIGGLFILIKYGLSFKELLNRHTDC